MESSRPKINEELVSQFERSAQALSATPVNLKALENLKTKVDQTYRRTLPRGRRGRGVSKPKHPLKDRLTTLQRSLGSQIAKAKDIAAQAGVSHTTPSVPVSRPIPPAPPPRIYIPDEGAETSSSGATSPAAAPPPATSPLAEPGSPPIRITSSEASSPASDRTLFGWNSQTMQIQNRHKASIDVAGEIFSYKDDSKTREYEIRGNGRGSPTLEVVVGNGEVRVINPDGPDIHPDDAQALRAIIKNGTKTGRLRTSYIVTTKTYASRVTNLTASAAAAHPPGTGAGDTPRARAASTGGPPSPAPEPTQRAVSPPASPTPAPSHAIEEPGSSGPIDPSELTGEFLISHFMKEAGFPLFSGIIPVPEDNARIYSRNEKAAATTFLDSFDATEPRKLYANWVTLQDTAPEVANTVLIALRAGGVEAARDRAEALSRPGLTDFGFPADFVPSRLSGRSHQQRFPAELKTRINAFIEAVKTQPDQAFAIYKQIETKSPETAAYLAGTLHKGPEVLEGAQADILRRANLGPEDDAPPPFTDSEDSDVSGDEELRTPTPPPAPRTSPQQRLAEFGVSDTDLGEDILGTVGAQNLYRFIEDSDREAIDDFLSNLDDGNQFDTAWMKLYDASPQAAAMMRNTLMRAGFDQMFQYANQLCQPFGAVTQVHLSHRGAISIDRIFAPIDGIAKKEMKTIREIANGYFDNLDTLSDTTKAALLQTYSRIPDARTEMGRYQNEHLMHAAGQIEREHFAVTSDLERDMPLLEETETLTAENTAVLSKFYDTSLPDVDRYKALARTLMKMSEDDRILFDNAAREVEGEYEFEPNLWDGTQGDNYKYHLDHLIPLTQLALERFVGKKRQSSVIQRAEVLTSSIFIDLRKMRDTLGSKKTNRTLKDQFQNKPKLLKTLKSLRKVNISKMAPSERDSYLKRLARVQRRVENALLNSTIPARRESPPPVTAGPVAPVAGAVEEALLVPQDDLESAALAAQEEIHRMFETVTTSVIVTHFQAIEHALMLMQRAGLEGAYNRSNVIRAIPDPVERLDAYRQYYNEITGNDVQPPEEDLDDIE